MCFLAKISLHRPTCKTTFARLTQSQANLAVLSRFHNFQIKERYDFFSFFKTACAKIHVRGGGQWFIAICGCGGHEKGYRLCYISVPEASVYWPLHTMGLFQPDAIQNQPCPLPDQQNSSYLLTISHSRRTRHPTDDPSEKRIPRSYP